MSSRRLFPPVTAVVVTFNSAHLIDACLDSLHRSAAGIERLTVVVVDNGSSDGTAERAQAHLSRPLVISQENYGYAAGINAGVAAVNDEASDVLVLNPDVRLGDGALSALAEAAQKPGVGIVVPKLFDGNRQLLMSLRREPTALRALGEALLGGDRAGRYPALGERVTDSSAYEQPTEADWATGAAMLITSKCWQAVGRWDETYFLYSEETDFALRAKGLGYSLRLVPEAWATHFGGDSDVSPRLYSVLTVNRVLLQRRRKGALRSLPFAASIFLGVLLRAAAGRPTARAALAALLRPKTFDPDVRRARDRNREQE